MYCFILLLRLHNSPSLLQFSRENIFVRFKHKYDFDDFLGPIRARFLGYLANIIVVDQRKVSGDHHGVVGHYLGDETLLGTTIVGLLSADKERLL